MKSSKTRPKVHIWNGLSEDLALIGGSGWRAYCSCGWVSRPCSGQGTAVGLFRRHIILDGRGSQG